MPKIDRTLLAASWRAWLSYEDNPPGGRALQWLWTTLLAVALAAGFTKFGVLVFADAPGAWHDAALWARWFGRNLVVCFSIAATIHLLFDALGGWARPRVPHWRDGQRTLFFAAVPLVGATIGWPLGLMLVGSNVFEWAGTPQGLRVLLGSLFLSLLLTYVLHLLFTLKNRQLHADKRATEAQLKLLQAQMEPHFLFNTLANVDSLITHDPARAQRMLAAFTDYLRASLGQLRRDDSTLGDELDLARTYLELLGTRMDERLRFVIDADDSLRRARVLPLMLQPLVENAIHHGLEPKIEGGCVTVRARAVDGRQLLIDVIDDGLGRDAAARHGRARRAGSGMALANLRERLAARYGPVAKLELADAVPGMRASLVLPLIEAAPSATASAQNHAA